MEVFGSSFPLNKSCYSILMLSCHSSSCVDTRSPAHTLTRFTGAVHTRSTAGLYRFYRRGRGGGLIQNLVGSRCGHHPTTLTVQLGHREEGHVAQLSDHKRKSVFSVSHLRLFEDLSFRWRKCLTQLSSSLFFSIL